MIPVKTRIYFLIVPIVVLFTIGKVAANNVYKENQGVTHHPFLIVTKDQFSGLRSRCINEPWKSMKEDAISRSASGSMANAYDLQDYIGAAALAYILDEPNAKIHASRVKEAILNQYSEIRVKEGSWGGVVPQMGSLFMAILALDVVYEALSNEDVTKCEDIIYRQISKINRTGNWQDARYGTHGTWDIYKGDRTTPDDNYYNGIMAQITEDGVSPVTIHYAWERVGGGDSRLSKSGYMDVLEFTGIDKRYYNNERIRKFQRWLFGSSVNCSKEMAIIGDMLPTQEINNDLLHRRVVNFDMEAAGYAAWFHQGVKAKGNILSYILPKEALPEPVVPSSKIYKNGGAFFREKSDNPNGLHLGLYNIMSLDEWHTHNEVNGLTLSGFGNRLLVNGGRLGAPTQAAYLNNTLTIDGKNHLSRLGGGIVEGFTTDILDYASGFSGDALPGNNHFRNAVLVHSTNHANAYSVIFDELTAIPGEQVKNYLHPANESQVTIVEPEKEYLAVIDHKPTVKGAKLSVFYVTKPVMVNITKVQSAVPDRYRDYPDHNRMESVYNLGSNGKINLATILFPFQDSLQKPSYTRISDKNFSGCSIRHSGNTIDLIMESEGEKLNTFKDISFVANFVLCRKSASGNQFYFVRKGSQFMQNKVGFESDVPISIFANGNEGVIISDGGAIVKLKCAGISGLKFEPEVEIIRKGKNFIDLKIPKGEVRFSEK